MDYLTSILGCDPLPRGSRLTYDGIWRVTAYQGAVKLMTLLLAHDRIQNPDDAVKVAQISFSKLDRLKNRDRVEVGFEESP